MTRSTRWKDLERETARLFGGTRILRGGDFSEEAPDVHVPGWDELKVDCKAYQRFAHHTLMDEIREKYCKEEGDVPILVTKAFRQQGTYATVPTEWLAGLLKEVRENA